jgi:hypothetical protein
MCGRFDTAAPDRALLEAEVSAINGGFQLAARLGIAFAITFARVCPVMVAKLDICGARTRKT